MRSRALTEDATEGSINTESFIDIAAKLSLVARLGHLDEASFMLSVEVEIEGVGGSDEELNTGSDHQSEDCIGEFISRRTEFVKPLHNLVVLLLPWAENGGQGINDGGKREL